MLRNSTDFVSWKDREGLATALKEVYRAVDAAEKPLSAFEAGPWGTRYPAIGQSWRRAWTKVIPFFAFPDDVRRIVYTTNAIEALNSKLCRAVRARGHFPNDEAATKLLYLILHRSEKEWENAATLVDHGQGPVRRHLRRTPHQSHGGVMFNRPHTHEFPDSPPKSGNQHQSIPQLELVMRHFEPMT